MKQTGGAERRPTLKFKCGCVLEWQVVHIDYPGNCVTKETCGWVPEKMCVEHEAVAYGIKIEATA